jgi:hypothetical protein
MQTHTHTHTHTHEYDADAGAQGLMRVVARRTYSPGEQVFVAYGDKSNDSLLQNYGFSEKDNPFDNFRLSSLLPWLEEHQVFFNLGLLQTFFSSLSCLGYTNMRYSFYAFRLFSTSASFCSCIALGIMRCSYNFLQLLPCQYFSPVQSTLRRSRLRVRTQSLDLNPLRSAHDHCSCLAVVQC